MNSKGILEENHKGGSLVYVPYDNLVYCISGILTSSVETINIFDDPDYEIKKSKTELSEPRAYFGTYVQNNTKIFVILGYNYMKNDFMISIEKLDTSSTNKCWKELFFINELNVPKLVFISCIPTSNDKIHIIGGLDENYFVNRAVYLVLISSSYFEIEITNMALPFEQEDEKICIGKDNNGISCLFYQENCFIPLELPSTDNRSFLFGLFDSKQNLHLTNLNNFNYCIISKIEDKPKLIKNAFHVANIINPNKNEEFGDNVSSNLINYNNQQSNNYLNNQEENKKDLVNKSEFNN
jgi:hypothetical protein